MTNAFLAIPGYELATDLRLDRQDTTGGIGGGVLVYAKTGLKLVPIDTGIVFTQHVAFKVLTETDSINFVLVYRPPRNAAESYHGLTQLIESVQANTVLVGDFNLPSIDWESGEARGGGGRKIF
jgi:hypothetical protein